MCTTFVHKWVHTCKSHANTYMNIIHTKRFVTRYFLSSLSNLLLLYEKWYFCVPSPFYICELVLCICMHVLCACGLFNGAGSSKSSQPGPGLPDSVPQAATMSCFCVDFGNLNSGPHVYGERALSMEPFPLPWLVYVHSTRLTFFICLRYVLRIHYTHFCQFLIVHRSSKLQIQLFLRIIFPSSRMILST